MSTKPLLTREEIILIQRNYLPKIYGEYRDIVEAVNAVSKRTVHIDGDDVYLGDADQIKLLKKVAVNVLELEAASKELKLYLRDIAVRLNLLP